MSELLYLDTARLGRMTPTAQRVHHAFTEMAGEEGGSAYFVRCLENGFDSLPTQLQTRYPDLAVWQGVDYLKESLLRLTTGRDDHQVFLANRSAQLMKLAARVLFHTCRNALVTDLDWPGYQEILQTEARRANRVVTCVPIRQLIKKNLIGEGELLAHLGTEFTRNGCDGLFLTAVSSDGIRLPVGPIVHHMRAIRLVRFVAVDGAQDFCHVGANLRDCDIYLTGAHKWLGAYNPLGIGIYGRRRTKGRIETILAHMASSGDLDDPLLRGMGGPDEMKKAGSIETISLAPLFSGQGAVHDGLETQQNPLDSMTARHKNRADVAHLSMKHNWLPVQTDTAFQSGILLLRPADQNMVRSTPETVRTRFRDNGVSISAYSDGVIRLSMPSSRWIEGQQAQLSDALLAVHRRFG